jgi:hypothetical protein
MARPAPAWLFGEVLREMVRGEIERQLETIRATIEREVATALWKLVGKTITEEKNAA